MVGTVREPTQQQPTCLNAGQKLGTMSSVVESWMKSFCHRPARPARVAEETVCSWWQTGGRFGSVSNLHVIRFRENQIRERTSRDLQKHVQTVCRLEAFEQVSRVQSTCLFLFLLHSKHTSCRTHLNISILVGRSRDGTHNRAYYASSSSFNRPRDVMSQVLDLWKPITTLETPTLSGLKNKPLKEATYTFFHAESHQPKA